MKLYLRQLIASLTFILAFSNVQAGTDKKNGFMDFNYYRDTRSYNTFTTNLLAEFDNSYQYFSLMDFFSDRTLSETTDSDFYYSEQNLRVPLGADSAFAVSSQVVFQSGNKNDILRAGVLMNAGKLEGWKEFFHKNHASFGVNFFPVQLDYRGGKSLQLEYFYKVQLFPEKLYLSGFADQNILDGHMTWVTEHQLGYSLADSFFVVAEYRINEYFKRQRGLGLGIEYIMTY